MELYQSLVAVEPATLIVTICNLFLQMYIVKKFFLSKVLAILDKRREAADQEIVQAQAAKEEAMAIKATYEENMKQAKAEANEILTHAQKTAAARSEEIIGQAQIFLPDGEIRVCDTQLGRGRDQIQIHKFFLLKPGCLLIE